MWCGCNANIMIDGNDDELLRVAHGLLQYLPTAARNDNFMIDLEEK